jgi:NADPH:quinone reductase-like Zn-dependent oxidoreductase
MRGIITDPQAPGGLRLADDLTEPEPAPGEVIVGVRAFSINAGEGEDLAILAGLMADGRLRPQIGWTADWSRTAGAFGAMARREFPGKAVLTIPG